MREGGEKMQKVISAVVFLLLALAVTLNPACSNLGQKVVPPSPNTQVGIDSSVKTGTAPYTTILTVTEANTGNVVLANVSVVLSGGFAHTLTNLNYPANTVFSGDSNGNGKLDVSEVWKWIIPNVTVSNPTTFTATGHGLFSQLLKTGTTTQDITYNPSTGSYPSEQMSVGVNAIMPLGTLGDLVWIDLNGNGLQDSGEPGVYGVTVNLYNNGSGSGSAIATTTTNVAGNYLFSDLSAGTYSVKFILPAGYSFTTANQGANSAIDSDANPASGLTGSINLTAGQTDLTRDAGLIGKMSTGDTATVGFWHNTNGQALINALNGGSISTALAAWLATNFPSLYGANSPNNLTGKTNADVAALFLTFFAEKDNTNAQMLAVALSVYVTNALLAGGTTAQGYGFVVSNTGAGALTYNVGSLGSDIGLVNNTSYTLLQLLQQADRQKSLGTFNASAFKTIFGNINAIGAI
jgi:hypothetical protein